MNVLRMWYESFDYFELANLLLKPVELINYRWRYVRVNKIFNCAFAFLLREKMKSFNLCFFFVKGTKSKR
jgi:hypothetical protein